MCKYCLKNEYNSCSYKWQKIPFASWNLPIGQHDNICNIHEDTRKQEQNTSKDQFKENSRIERCADTIEDLFEKARAGYLGEYLTRELITKRSFHSSQITKMPTMETIKIPYKKTDKNRRKNRKSLRTVFKDFSIFYNNIVEKQGGTK
ncbi:uncharacterized protein LOC124420839 [Lucilia cuprina]|uniref:uncharacterized protein LOC124420839 n=1 Tax=Lucilia cuprina TaxID=7375 RepID=UPI001F06F16E|nr:uncharacterized protein LOC124420839 [Lucilia cuprina]